MYILSQCQIFPRFYKKYCGGGVSQRNMLTLLGLVKEQARSCSGTAKRSTRSRGLRKQAEVSRQGNLVNSTRQDMVILGPCSSLTCTESGLI